MAPASIKIEESWLEKFSCKIGEEEAQFPKRSGKAEDASVAAKAAGAAKAALSKKRRMESVRMMLV
ncbi:MAG: hypothetical protein NVS9B13_23950 [Candidatus Acidiferrum sp.]